MAHVRYKIYDIHIRLSSVLTKEAKTRIGELYITEANVRGISAEQCLAEREPNAKSLLKLLESLEPWLAWVVRWSWKD